MIAKEAEPSTLKKNHLIFYHYNSIYRVVANCSFVKAWQKRACKRHYHQVLA
jgi:hypothetical protein